MAPILIHVIYGNNIGMGTNGRWYVYEWVHWWVDRIELVSLMEAELHHFVVDGRTMWSKNEVWWPCDFVRL